MENYKGGSWVLSDQHQSFWLNEKHDFDVITFAKVRNHNEECITEKKLNWDGPLTARCEATYGFTTTTEPWTTSETTTTTTTTDATTTNTATTTTSAATTTGSTTTSADTTTSQVSDEKTCAFTDDFKRQCDDAVDVPRLETPEECLEECQQHPHCDKAHWHPGHQIWENDPRPVCFMFGVGSATCNWNGHEGPDGHPGAKMIQCDAPSCSLEDGYEANLCKSGKNGAYCDFDEDHEKASCYSCESMKTPQDCSDSNDEDSSTCLQEYGCLRQFFHKTRIQTRTELYGQGQLREGKGEDTLATGELEPW